MKQGIGGDEMPRDETEAVERVLLDYATAIDTKDWDLFRSCFVDGCLMTSPAGPVIGAVELTRHMAELHEPLDSSLHRLTNLRIEMAGDTATAHSYLDALLVRTNHPEGPTFRVAGTYQDRLVRDGTGRWKLQERRFTPVWREGNARVLAKPPPPLS